MDFNPNNLNAPEAPIWATYVPERRPKFKSHTQRSHALGAFQYRRNVILYKFIDSEWVEVYRIENGHDDVMSCDRCGGQPEYGYWRSVWERGEDGKIKEPLRRLALCSWDCQRAEEGK
jgi:hypothetical protein